MRINKFLALASSLSRRGADAAIANGRVWVNGRPAQTGQEITDHDQVLLDSKPIHISKAIETIMLYKPTGFIVSRDGQGSRTIYELLPPDLHHLNPVGRLDKDSSGLLLLTNDGAFAERLTHPRYQKEKIYEVSLNKPLEPLHHQMINDYGVQLEDGPSRLLLERVKDNDNKEWRVHMHEGRNRQIRRTFSALGYSVTKLHRTHFGDYNLGALKPGAFKKA